MPILRPLPLNIITIMIVYGEIVMVSAVVEQRDAGRESAGQGLERTEVSEYEDKTAIIQILNLYALALDSHQWELFERIFTDDVRAEFGPASAAWPTRAALVSAFADFHKTLDGHQHT